MAAAGAYYISFVQSWSYQSVGGTLEDDARGDLDLERRRNCQISTPAISNAIPKPAITSSIVGRGITCDPAGLARPFHCVRLHQRPSYAMSPLLSRTMAD